MRALVTVVVLAALAQSARADEASARAARQLFAEGQAEYAKGDYRAAAAKFEAAFANDPDPAYVFNLGQAYRLAKNCARAAATYRKLLELSPGAANADEVRAYIREMDACTPSEPVQPVQPPPPDRPPPVRALPPPAPEAARYPTTAVAALAVGAAALVGVGVWAALDARSAARERETLCLAVDGCVWGDAQDRQSDDLDTRGTRSSVIAIGSLVASGAAIAGAVTLHVLHVRHRRDRTLSITSTRGGAIVTHTLRF
jgi:tetratricopeptide (TPR) repeat protein